MEFAVTMLLDFLGPSFYQPVFLRPYILGKDHMYLCTCMFFQKTVGGMIPPSLLRQGTQVLVLSYCGLAQKIYECTHSNTISH